MNKKLILVLSVFLLLIIIPTAFADCNVNQMRRNLRHVMFEYFENPNTATLNVDRIRDLLEFYLTIPSGQNSVVCNQPGTHSGIVIENIVQQSDGVLAAIPVCSDETEYGECSNNLPLYCNNGNLENNCGICGCDSENICNNNICVENTTQENNATNTTQNQSQTCGDNQCNGNETCSTCSQDCGTCPIIACNSHEDCNFGTTYFCSNGNVYGNTTNETCVNPGTESSYCQPQSTTWQADTCQNGEQCINGQQTCQEGICGDTVCGGDETVYTCAVDCGTCTDSDGGINYAEYGVVQSVQGGQAIDNCGTSTHLREWYCDNGVRAMETYNCPGGCLNGVCQGSLCYSDADCPGNTFSYFCSGGDVYSNLTNGTCSNPGTGSASCQKVPTITLHDDCSAQEVCSFAQCRTNPIELGEITVLGQTMETYTHNTGSFPYVNVLFEMTINEYPLTGPQGITRKVRMEPFTIDPYVDYNDGYTQNIEADMTFPYTFQFDTWYHYNTFHPGKDFQVNFYLQGSGIYSYYRDFITSINFTTIGQNTCGDAVCQHYESATTCPADCS